MSRFTRIVSPIAIASTMGAGLAAGTVFVPSASASDNFGCSPPYQKASIEVIYGFSEGLVPQYFPTDAALMQLLTSLDHNGDGELCWKIPPGWTGPPALNGAHRQGFVNLVDDNSAAQPTPLS